MIFESEKYMKKLLCLFLFCVFALELTSCTSILKDEKSSVESTTESVLSDETESYSRSTENTDTITVDGVVYRNGFQGDMIFRNVQYGSEPVYEDNDGKYFRLTGTEHDLIYNVYCREIGAPEGVFCRDDQWQELSRYYSDMNNFTFMCIANENESGGGFNRIILKELDIEKLRELAEFCDENSYDPYAFFGNKNTRKVSTSSLGAAEYRFIMNSNDEHFSYGAGFLYVIDDKLVLKHYDNASQKTTLVVDVPEDLSRYFISVINSLEY